MLPLPFILKSASFFFSAARTQKVLMYVFLLILLCCAVFPQYPLAHVCLPPWQTEHVYDSECILEHFPTWTTADTGFLIRRHGIQLSWLPTRLMIASPRVKEVSHWCFVFLSSSLHHIAGNSVASELKNPQLSPSGAVFLRNEVQIVCAEAWSYLVYPLITSKLHCHVGTSRNTLKGNERSVRRGSCRGTVWHHCCWRELSKWWPCCLCWGARRGGVQQRFAWQQLLSLASCWCGYL